MSGECNVCGLTGCVEDNHPGPGAPGPLTCQGCGTAESEHRVRWRSFDMDLPALRLCVICTHLIWTDPQTFEAMGARRVL